MAIYSYKCTKCDSIIRKLEETPSSAVKCTACGASASFQFPSSASATTYETRDKYRGKKLPKNNAKLLKRRMKEHHDNYEIEEKIDKEGLEEAQKQGWTKKIKRK